MVIYITVFLILRVRDVFPTRGQRLVLLSILLLVSILLTKSLFEGALILLLGTNELLYTVRPIALFRTCSDSHLSLLHADNPGVLLTAKYAYPADNRSKGGLRHARHSKPVVGDHLYLGARQPGKHVDDIFNALMAQNHQSNGRLIARIVRCLSPLNLRQLLCVAAIGRFLHTRSSAAHQSMMTVVTELSTAASVASCESEIEQIHVLGDTRRCPAPKSQYTSLIERIRISQEAHQSKHLLKFLRRRCLPLDKRKTNVPFQPGWDAAFHTECEANPPSEEATTEDIHCPA